MTPDTADFIEVRLNPFTFGPSTGAWGDVPWMGIMDAPIGGNQLMHWRLPDVLRIPGPNVAVKGEVIFVVDVSAQSPAPPSGDKLVRGADYGLFLAFRGYCTAPPVSTKALDKAAAATPNLKEELRRLCLSYSPSDLSALADALRASVKGLVEEGANPYETPPALQAKIQAWLYRGESRLAIARMAAPTLPKGGGTSESQLKRARRMVDRLAQDQPSLMINREIARRIVENRHDVGRLRSLLFGGSMAGGQNPDIKSRAPQGGGA